MMRKFERDILNPKDESENVRDGKFVRDILNRIMNAV